MFFRSESSFRAQAGTEGSFFHACRSVSGNLVKHDQFLFVLKFLFSDHVKNEHTLCSSLIPALSPTFTALKPSKAEYVQDLFNWGSQKLTKTKSMQK